MSGDGRQFATEFESRPTRWIVGKKGDAAWAEGAFVIEIDDEGGGEFVTLNQNRDPADDPGKIMFDCEEWHALRAAIDAVFAECRG